MVISLCCVWLSALHVSYALAPLQGWDTGCCGALRYCKCAWFLIYASSLCTNLYCSGRGFAGASHGLRTK